MTSEKSFWASLLKQNIQRLWMWIISILCFIILYPSMLIAYFNRVRFMFGDEISPFDMKNYIREMKEAICDCLGYNTGVVYFLLAGFFALGIFAYLNNKSKMDMLKSVPVSTKKMYLSDYVSGILMCVVPYILALVISVIIAASSGYMTSLAIGEMFIAFFINITLFIIYYSLGVICVCITGNLVMAGAAFLSLSLAQYCFVDVIEELQSAFFKTKDWQFSSTRNYFSPIMDYINKYYALKEANNIEKELKMLGVNLVLWVVLAVILVILSYVSYTKRPAEALNKACYNSKIRAAAKIYLGIIATISAAFIAYGTAGDSKTILVIGIIAGGVLIGMAFEAIFAMDIKAVTKSLWSTGVIVAVSMCVFLFMNFDIFGYDRYVPTTNSVESFAIDLYPNMYGEVYDFQIAGADGKKTASWYANTDYYKEHMIITDVDAISQLAKKCADKKLYLEENENIKNYSVYYRKKGFGTVGRRIYVDMKDEESVALVNRIAASTGWKEGNFQVLSDKDNVEDVVTKITYNDGITTYTVDASFEQIVDAYKKDLEKFDYYLGSTEISIGNIRIELTDYNRFTLPVYGVYSNVLDIISKCEGYTDKALTADEVESIRVINYHSEYWDEDRENVAYDYTPEVTTVITDKAKIQEILEASSPSGLSKYWSDYDKELSNYSVDVFLSKDRGDYRRGDCINCYFVKYVPAWLAQETKMQ